MHDNRRVIEQRLTRVLDQRLRPAVHTGAVPLAVAVWDAPGEPVPVGVGLAAPYRPVAVGHRWGPPWSTSWFRVTGQVPREWAGRRVEALVDLGFDKTGAGFSSEGLVHRADGTVVKGLHPRNAWIPVADPAAGGEQVAFHIEAAANPTFDHFGEFHHAPTPLGRRPPWLTGGGPPGEPLYRLLRADLTVLDTDLWDLVQDLDVLDQLMRSLPLDSPRRWQLLRAADRALDTLDLQNPAAGARAAREAVRPALAAPATAGAHRISAIGHAHIDTAWLWPLREAERKVARTLANVTQLMDEHPGFRFAMSQAQQLAWMKENRPGIYARVREKAAAGQFLPVGSLWVEPDTNITGGESLVRQLVHGKRFYQDEFGVETAEMWLPDTFGYNAALPQLMKLAGIRWFLTQKISWNTINRFPHHTFWWEGIDGTRIFSHFPPADTYNSELSGAELAHAVSTFQDKGTADRSLVPFGYGDGGGGPTREMLARADRLADLEGSPKVAIEHPAAFFTRAHREYPDAPVWLGELYLEFHRGTLTSQLKTKQGNRRNEHLLREAELWCATATVHAGRAYPYDALDRLWKTVLLHQFHDILPGSSTAWVHHEAEQAHTAITAELRTLTDAARHALAGPGDATVVFNAAPHTRGGIPALGAALRPHQAHPPVDPAPSGRGFVLDNGLIRIEIDERGLITSARDLRAHREALPPGTAANLLQLHQDFPNEYDAWELDAFYRNTRTDLLEADSVTATGAGVRVVRTFGDSRVEQLLTLPAHSRRLDIDTDIEWREREKILKAAFPLDLRAEHSTAEIPFGHVKRPTHTNTSWDAAKFEICAHRFLHLEEPGWGAALLNDSTYGHDITRAVRPDGGTTTTARLSLLRAARYPDPDADQGHHRLHYALLLGAGIADAVREGYRTNLPERAVPGSRPVTPLVALDTPSVVVEALKLADDRSGDVVVRLYEAHGARTRARLTTGFPLASAHPADLLERPLADPAALDTTHLPHRSVDLTLRPFQILTLRLRPAR
ncbi:glycoside hydrolase family 38 C-terminal domain-containing protein [Streptomyces sp. LS1784]|uniref:alpha-mannosidase n=1 Tax=Streptomyces sp. LS1784 TaxID=2851533 RepID=UPI001CCC13B6|nr:glycoside hydrolase family 38 C-terminal domain-containing protein [Streptomyces sp. LS1784]